MASEQNTEVSFGEVITQGRQYLDSSDPQECIQLLAPIALDKPGQQELLPLYQLLGEAFLESGNPKDAYDLFKSCAELDPEGALGGIEKFLWLGQLTGGREGESWFEKGIQGLRQDITKLTAEGDKKQDELKLKKLKLCEALCGIVEIWMTDLW